jgi:multidrug efflux pump subunit AcrB
VPALISTMSSCIVFVPVTLLSGSAKYIFTPLALNVVLALVASYGLSRTLVPTMMHFLLPKEAPLYQGQEAVAAQPKFHLALPPEIRAWI